MKAGTLINGTVGNYLQAVGRIKQHPIGNRKLKTVTSEHLQKFMDLLAFGGEEGNFKSKGYTIDYIRSFHIVLQDTKVKKEHKKQIFSYGELYQRNYYKEVREKNRVYYDFYHLDGTADIPLDYKNFSL